MASETSINVQTARTSCEPCRLRRGMSLVELLVAMLILTLVCIAWLQIIGIQSARKEARRREAVERLAGMMDAFMYNYQRETFGSYCYYVEPNGYLRSDASTITFGFSRDTTTVYPIFEGEVSPIGYQLQVVAKPSWPSTLLSSSWPWQFSGRGTSCRWLVGRLYQQNGTLAEAGAPFFTLPVCLGR